MEKPSKKPKKKNSIIRVSAAFLVKGGRFLIARRGPQDRLAGRWEFPGGKVEHDETLQQSLVRELQEELNLHITVNALLGTHIHHYDHISIELLMFRATLLGGRIMLNEHADYRWVDKSDLSRFEFSDADVYFVNKIERGEIVI